MAMVRPITHVAKNFCCQHQLIAPPAALGKPSPDDGFGNALASFPAVNVGSVEEIDAKFQGSIHNNEAVRFAGHWPKIHCAKAQPADFQPGSSKISVLHARSPYHLFIICPNNFMGVFFRSSHTW